MRGRKSAELGMEDDESQEEEQRGVIYNKRKSSRARDSGLVEIEIQQNKER